MYELNIFLVSIFQSIRIESNRKLTAYLVYTSYISYHALSSLSSSRSSSHLNPSIVTIRQKIGISYLWSKWYIFMMYCIWITNVLHTIHTLILKNNACFYHNNKYILCNMRANHISSYSYYYCQVINVIKSNGDLLETKVILVMMSDLYVAYHHIHILYILLE